MDQDIITYNQKLAKADQVICSKLAEIIDASLKKAESKIWHGHPVWFLDGNPVVGYSKLKDSVRLLFWSGQSFEEKALIAQGSFKASDVRYLNEAEIIEKDIKRWLKKAKDIQWDYKNIVKRKGVLERLV